MLEVFDAIKTSIAPSPRTAEPRASRDAASVVRRAMSRRPEDRYESAALFADELEALSEGRSTLARRDEGGLLRRGWSQFRLMTSGVPQEYKSSTRWLGLPLIHVYSGPRLPGQPTRVARGWFAAGDVAIGGIAMGRVTLGGVAIGALSFGALFSWGGVAGALFCAFGGISLAPLSWGGIAFGYLAIGGAAIGYGAIGGWARGVYATGGNAKGDYLIEEGPNGISAEEWFDAVLPGLSKLFAD